MIRFRKLVPLLVCLLLLFLLAMSPGQSGVVQAQGGATVTYHLYATDGYYELPDGEELYMYGFIGGDASKPFVYQDTTWDPSTGLTHANKCGDGTPYDPNVGCAPTAVPPAPTAGSWTGMDATYAGHAQFPAPIIHASAGDVVEIRLKNLGVAAKPDAPNDPHSIHLHGLDVDAANDGVPETSLGAIPANWCENQETAVSGNCGTEWGAPPAPGAGNVIVYMFTSDHPGTYMYHCHQEAQIHVQMGMFGALVIYNPGDPAAMTGPGMGNGGQLYGVPYDKDYVMLISEFDVGGHQDEEGTYPGPGDYNWAYYQPEYWSINGLSFPQTIHVGLSGYSYADWIAAHRGYETLYTGSISGGSGAWGTPGEKVLLRVINMGFESHPLHMHGYHGKVIGSDARAWDWAFAPKSKTNKAGMRPFGEGLEKNTLVIGSGETYDWLVDFGQQSFQAPPYPGGPAGTLSRYYDGDPFGACGTQLSGAGPLPAKNTPVSNIYELCPVIPDFGEPGGAPYIGGPAVAGVVDVVTGEHLPPLDPANNTPPGQAQSQYFPFHNHDDYKATNNGEYPGGMFTFLVPTQ